MSDQFDPYHVWLGIPPEEQPPNHYRLLGLRLFEADGDVISNALDQRLAHLRTLQAGKRGALSQKLLNEVSAAGVVLLDPKRKGEYDQQLRTKQAAEKATPAPRKTALLKARSLEADALAAAVVPLGEQAPSPAAAPLSPISPANTVAVVQPVSGPRFTAPTPLAIGVQSSAPHRQSRGSGVGAAIAIVALCVIGLGATVAIAAWMLNQPPARSSLPVAAAPGHAVSPPSAPSPSTSSPTAPVVAPPTIPSAVSPPPIPSPMPPIVPAAPAPMPDSRQVWVYADNARGGFRWIEADRWVELREKDAVWYQQTSTAPDAITLAQLGGSATEVKLLADRLERRNAEFEGTTVFFGKWRSLEGLPPFARRDPGPQRPVEEVNRARNKYGLLFDGRGYLESPVPEELRTGGHAFTLELSVRWADSRADSCLVECGNVRLGTVSGGANPQAAALTLTGGGPTLHVAGLNLAPGKYHHLAITSDGQDGFLVINGQVNPQAKIPGLRSLGSGPLRIGFDSKRQVGFRGILRGLRISNVNRYPNSTPQADLPRLMPADDLTLLAIDFRSQKNDQVLLSGSSGGSGKRLGPQWAPLGYEAEYVAESTPGRADLMRSFTTSLHTLEGRTFRTANELQIQSPTGRSAVLLPYLPPAAYRYETTVTRTGGDGGLVIGLVLGQEPAMVLVDASAGESRSTGLLTGNSQVVPGTTPATNLRLLTQGTSRKLACDVITQSGAALVQVWLDGQMAYQWKGPIQSVPLPSEWQIPARTMFVGSRDATFSFAGMTVTPLPPPPPEMFAGIPSGIRPSTSASPPPAVASSPASSSSTSSSPLPSTSPPASGKPPPDAQTLAAELAKARTIYEDELKRATKPEQKAAVAKNILKVGQETTSDSTVRYVLIDLARKVFIQAGDVKEALSIVRLLESEFELPANELQIATIEGLDDAQLIPEQRAALASAAIELAEVLLDREQFEPAEKLASVAVQSAARQKDAELKKEVAQRRGQLVRVVAASQAVQGSLKTLQESPDDPAANLAVGRFRCLVLEDWSLGLPNLAKSGQSSLAAAAALDQESQKKAESALAAADAWINLSKDTKAGDRDERQAMKRRAKSLLEAALPKLVNLDKVKAEKQLSELKDVAAAANTPGRNGMRGARGGREFAGLIGRVVARNRDAGIVVTYRPDYTLSAADFQKLQAAAGIAPGEPWGIEFVGQLVLPVDTRVQVWHAGGSVSGGVHTLYFGAQQITKVGDDLPKNISRTLTLPKGVHAVRWVLSGGDMGTAAMRISPVDNSGTPVEGGPKVMVPRELDAAVRQAAYKSEFAFGF